MKKKIVSIVGARPNFIKLAALHTNLKKSFNHVIVHTGQHYDYELSEGFFDEFSIPTPNYNLQVSLRGHNEQIKLITSKCEKVLISEKPDLVIVYGDTNSTVGGAEASKRVNIPVAHVEAGIRCFSKNLPEEKNRIFVDKISTLLFCPSQVAVENLKKENIDKNVFDTGDVMYDVFLKTKPDYSIFKKNRIKDDYFFATIHRQENTDDKLKLKSIMNALNELSIQVIIPLHPRTEQVIRKINKIFRNLKFIKPVKYNQNIALQQKSKAVITDSGGIQKEAYWLKVPCITLRESTEWIETISSGWNRLVGTDQALIKEAVSNLISPRIHPDYYGKGSASIKIIKTLKNHL